jgi:hypothetical protein
LRVPWNGYGRCAFKVCACDARISDRALDEKAVPTAQEYRRLAQNCRDTAAHMSIADDREHLLRMAEDYEARARDAERQPGNG